VPAGTYHVTEGADPTGFEFESLSCEASAGSSGTPDGTDPKKAEITLVADGVVTCTYVNKQQQGAIKITKTGKDKNQGSGGPSALRGDILDQGPRRERDRSEDDRLRWNGVRRSPAVRHVFGPATAAPSGYAIDDGTAHSVAVFANSTCGDGNEATFSATDTPRTDVLVRAKAQKDGATQSTSPAPRRACRPTTLATRRGPRTEYWTR
jgi:hypothetical protein